MKKNEKSETERQKSRITATTQKNWEKNKSHDSQKTKMNGIIVYSWFDGDDGARIYRLLPLQQQKY